MTFVSFFGGARFGRNISEHTWSVEMSTQRKEIAFKLQFVLTLAVMLLLSPQYGRFQMQAVMNGAAVRGEMEGGGGAPVGVFSCHNRA